MESLTRIGTPFGELLNDFFYDLPMRKRTDTMSPAINVKDTDENYEIEVSAPGYKKENFNVDIEDGFLTISNKTENSSQESDKNYTIKEFSRYSFSKSFSLPKNTDTDGIKANYKDGILSIILPKKKDDLKRLKKIEIS